MSKEEATRLERYAANGLKGVGWRARGREIILLDRNQTVVATCDSEERALDMAEMLSSLNRIDELTFLRKLEQTIKDAQRTERYSEIMLCVSEARIAINNRIIEVLAERVELKEDNDGKKQ